MVSHGGFIAYYRVSTSKQGKSGLGIEAQRQAVANYLNGGNWRIIAEFTEIESGKRSDRPALDKALAAARVRQVPLECMVGQEGRAVRRATATAISSMGSGRCAGPCEHKFGRSGRCSERRSSEQSRARRLNGPSRSGEFPVRVVAQRCGVVPWTA